MKRKVLIVNSVDDGITQNRIELLNVSPLTTDFELFHAYAARKLNQDVTLNEMLFRIELAIKDYKPEYLIFHTGGSFHRQPELFMNCVVYLKQKYQNVKFGYQPNSSNECQRYFDTLKEFDRGVDMAKVVGILFFKVLEFLSIKKTKK